MKKEFEVKCIDNEDQERKLTIGKKYKVEDEDNLEYWIVNDDGEKRDYFKYRFKPVEPQKEEKKEYSVMELFEEKEETKFEINGLDYKYFVLNGILRRTIDGILSETLYLNKAILKSKFTKVEEPKPVTTSEAMKALEAEREIESTYTGDRYKIENGLLVIKTKGLATYSKCGNIHASELMNSWNIL